MSDKVQISDNLLIPGDIIRFEYELLTANETIAGEAVSAIKKQIATDDRLDYQGSEIEDRVDLETGTAHKILSIYASVRRTRREQRGEIQHVELSTVEAEMKVVATIWAGSVQWVKTVVMRGVQALAQAAEGAATVVSEGGKAVVGAIPLVSVAALLIGAVVFYKYFLD